ncbi:MAG: sugar phosphate isomerase/epimerase family protein [Ardenticatenaceae bacterium]
MTPPIALQLYTVRDLLADDFVGTMEQVAGMGYVGVETAFFGEHMSAAQAGKLFQALGLTVVAAHCEIPLGEEQAPVLEMMAALDCRRMIWHGWPRDEDYGSMEGIKRLAERYNAANAVAQANGMGFGIHNHWWEFESVEGRYPYQILLKEMDPTIFFEIDTYWVKTAGLDPVKVLEELGSRAPVLHIKDGPATRHEPMVAVGDGTMDFAAILAAAEGHTECLVVELDECATDMMDAVARSYEYLVGGGFAYGKS